LEGELTAHLGHEHGERADFGREKCHGPVRDGLVTHPQQQADWLNRPVSPSVIATVMERAERDPDMRRLRDEMFGRAGEHLTDALAPPSHAVNYAPASRNTPGDLAPRIVGPLLFQRLMPGAQPDRETVADTVDAALATWQPHTRQPHAVRPNGSSSGRPAHRLPTVASGVIPQWRTIDD
jgi:hypothetical protein